MIFKNLSFASFVFLVAASSYGQHGHGVGQNDPPKWKIQLKAEGSTTGLRRLAGVPFLAFETDLVTWQRFCPTAWYDGLTGAGIGFSYSDTLREGDNMWDNHALGVASVGAFQAMLAWHPGDEGALPPKKLYYRLTAGADSGNMGGQVQNGLGSPSSYSPFLLGYMAHGSKMFKAELGGASQFLTPALSVNAAASNSSALGSPRASVGFSVQVLEPSFIVSPFETSYSRMGYDRVENKRDSDKGLVVDSVATWDSYLKKWVGQVRLEAKQNLWSVAKPTWNYGGAELVSSEFSQGEFAGGPFAITIRKVFETATQSLEGATMVNLVTSDWSQTEDIQVDNTYKVRWHMPYENWFEFAPRITGQRNPSSQDGQPAEGAGEGGIYSFRWNRISPSWGNFIETAPDVFGTIADVIPFPFVQALSSILGFIIGQSDDGWVQEGASFGEHWDNPESEFIPDKDERLRNRYRMTASVHIGILGFPVESEGYDSNGYIGQIRKMVVAEDGRKWTHATFTLRKLPGGPDPNPGGGQ